MSNLYYTTINGETSGRASYYFKSRESAEARCDKQNGRAQEAGLKARYSVAERVDVKNIRD